jgi:pyrroloquinoline quinone (PQQ) biosynthesis protein C
VRAAGSTVRSPTATVWDRLRRDAASWAEPHHPWRAWLRAEVMTPTQLGRFAAAYGPHVMHTRLYQARALALAPTDALQKALADILNDEYGGDRTGRTHPDQYRRFAHAAGISDEQFVVLPAHLAYRTALESLTSHHWATALGAAGLAGEWPIPELYGEIIQAIGTGVGGDALELFHNHIVLDEEHAARIERAIDDATARERNAATVYEHLACGLELALRARNRWHSGLLEYVVGD